MGKSAKRAFLHVSKWLGLFRLARVLTRRGLRILCYHGFSLEDEARFRPSTFMEPATFRARLAYLAKERFPVLGLAEALDAMDRGTLPRGATVITFDDGFYSLLPCALEPLRALGFPATVYVATYHTVKGTPVFRHMVRYMLWKTTARDVEMAGLSGDRSGRAAIGEEDQKRRVAQGIIEHAERACAEDERGAIATLLGERLGIPYGPIAARRALSRLTSDEIRALAASGIDIQLHTHRHRFPLDEAEAKQELADNRAVIEPLLGRTLSHFCYPSGRWSDAHFRWLSEASIVSAVTCDPGFNYPDTPRLALKRFLDGQHIASIEFEAEMCGYLEILRRLRAVFGERKR